MRRKGLFFLLTLLLSVKSIGQPRPAAEDSKAKSARMAASNPFIGGPFGPCGIRPCPENVPIDKGVLLLFAGGLLLGASVLRKFQMMKKA